jgi:hypothetical protein
MEDDEIARMPERLLKIEENRIEAESTRLGRLMASIDAHSLESLGVTDSIADLDRSLGSRVQNDSLLPHFDRIMGEKKMHEVRD